MSRSGRRHCEPYIEPSIVIHKFVRIDEHMAKIDEDSAVGRLELLLRARGQRQWLACRNSLTDDRALLFKKTAD